MANAIPAHSAPQEAAKKKITVAKPTEATKEKPVAVPEKGIKLESHDAIREDH